MKDNNKKFIFGVLSDIFYVSLVSYLIFVILELVNPRFISAFINLNALLTIALITGIITVSHKSNSAN